MRTEYDLEMMQEMGFCQGIENYSRHLTGRAPGSRPGHPDRFLPGRLPHHDRRIHATVPQIGGMYEGDRSRKTTLVDFGFRLPSALDNRPLRFHEFMELTDQRLYVSATPATFEIENCDVGNEGLHSPQRNASARRRRPGTAAANLRQRRAGRGLRSARTARISSSSRSSARPDCSIPSSR